MINADIPEGIGLIMPIGSAGNVAVVTAAGQEDVWPLDKKEYFSIAVRRVKATGTTATGIRMFR